MADVVNPEPAGEPVLAWLTRHSATMRQRELEFDNPKLEYRRLFSEVWGTFLLVLVAAGGGVVGATAFGGDLTLAMKALAPGMMVMGIIFFMGTISGAHLNPAVTLAFAVRGNFPWQRVPGYIVAQVVGAVLAAWFLQLTYGGILERRHRTHQGREPRCGHAHRSCAHPGAGERHPGDRLRCAQRGHQRRHRSRCIHRLGLGLGGAGVRGVDEPRALVRPEFVGWDLTNYWIYLVGPIIGAMVAVGFEYILKGRATAAGAEAAQGILDENPEGL